MGEPSLWTARRRCIVAIVVTMTVVCSSCGLIDFPPDPDTTGLTPPTIVTAGAPTVLWVGDSITEFARGTAEFVLAARGWNHAVVGRAGSTLAQNRARLLGAKELKPAALVVELGSNDLGEASNTSKNPTADDREDAVADAISHIGSALDDLDGMSCVVWVNVSTWTNFFGYDTTRSGPLFNRELDSQALKRPWLHIVDYAGLFRPDDPEREAALKAEFDDQLLHPISPAANVRWTNLVAETVHQSCGI